MGIDDATKGCIDCSTKNKGIVDGKCTECPAKQGINSLTKLCSPCFPFEGIDPITKKCITCSLDGDEIDSVTKVCKSKLFIWIIYVQVINFNAYHASLDNLFVNNRSKN